MDITIAQLLTAAPVLASLTKQTHKGRTSFAIRRLAQKLQPEVATACAARDTLFTADNSYRVDDQWHLNPEHAAKFLADPLFAEVIAIDCEPLTEDMLTDALISPQELGELGPLLQ